MTTTSDTTVEWAVLGTVHRYGRWEANVVTPADDQEHAERIARDWRHVLDKAGRHPDAVVVTRRTSVGPWHRPEDAAPEEEDDWGRVIDAGRRDLWMALDQLDRAISGTRAAIENLASEDVYDVEVAEGDQTLRDTALTGLRLHAAALRHVLRDAEVPR